VSATFLGGQPNGKEAGLHFGPGPRGKNGVYFSEKGLLLSPHENGQFSTQQNPDLEQVCPDSRKCTCGKTRGSYCLARDEK